ERDCIVIGDSLHADMQGAIRSGIKTIWYNPHRKKSELNIDYEIQDLLEIKEII
ncbi:MAG: HAD hydrolase-like protein, partial [Holdemanella sp.]|nr:HAD hydrolase-like protein [Holdemanella sp.]